jgi:hypothetical protein
MDCMSERILINIKNIWMVLHDRPTSDAGVRRGGQASGAKCFVFSLSGVLHSF